jgi:hypothetical protein
VWAADERADDDDKVKLDIKKAGTNEVIAQVGLEAFFTFDEMTE